MSEQQQNLTELYDADFILNRNLFKISYYTFCGFGLGLASCIFFKNKIPPLIYFTGVGSGFALNDFYRDIRMNSIFARKE